MKHLTATFENLGPSRLKGAREKIEILHPGTTKRPAILPVGAISDLKRRIVEAAGEDRLADLLPQLTPREVRTLIVGLEQWGDLRAECGWLLRRRASGRHIGRLWSSWQHFPRIPEISTILIALVEVHGWSSVNSTHADQYYSWLRSDAPGILIQEWLESRELSAQDLRNRAHVDLEDDTQLIRLVRDALLTHGSRRQLLIEGWQSLKAWLAEASPSTIFGAGQNFLAKLPVGGIDRSLLDDIVDRYGLPLRPTSTRFWEPIPEEAKKEVQRLYIRERIHDFFHSDKDRRDYWIRWEDYLSNVQRGFADGVEYGLLDFGNFGVVEFFETGNAAFFYSEERFSNLLSRRVVRPSSLKDKYSPDFMRGGDNRLLHMNPPRGWYAKANSMVKRWMKASTPQ